MHSMKIVHIITRLIRGGAEENTVLTCNWFAEAGHDVTLLHGDEWDAEMVGQVNPRIKRRYIRELCRNVSLRRDIHAAIVIRSVLRQIRPDVVHTHESKAGVVGRAAAMYLPGCVIVHGIHILPFLNVGPWKRYLYLGLERLVAPATDGFISVSEVLQEAAIAHGLGHAERHYVAHSGMDIARFISARRCLEHRQDAKPLRALYLANYEPRKRHLELLQELDRRRAEFAGVVRFRFCGRGHLLGDCDRIVRERELSDIVEISGLVSNPESAIADAHVGIYCSGHEGLPRAIVQYCAAGKPVVAMGLPGLETVVKHDQNGIVVPQADLESLGDALLHLARNDHELIRLSRGSEQLDLSEWSVERMCTRIAEIYSALGAPMRRSQDTNTYDAA